MPDFIIINYNLQWIRFFLKLTLPTKFSNQSATLIDSVFSTNIEEKEVTGILLSHISDHQLLFTYIENFSYIEKHKKSKWMTTGILNSINTCTKDGLYKPLLKTGTNNDDYRVAKPNFKRYRDILRNNIKRTKMWYYKRTFNFYQNDVNKTWTLIKDT